MTLLVRRWLRGACGVLLLGVLVGATVGCQLFRRATGATDSATIIEQKSGDGTTTAPAEPDTPADAPPRPEPDAAAETTPEATQPVPQPAQPDTSTDAPPRPKPDASADTTPKAHEPVPEVDEVSIVDPAEPRLLSADEEVPLASLQLRVTRAETLSTTLQQRELPEEMAAQVDSGRAFLQDAKDALNTGDLKRADVLIDKCLVLLEDAEQQTRP